MLDARFQFLEKAPAAAQSVEHLVGRADVLREDLEATGQDARQVDGAIGAPGRFEILGLLGASSCACEADRIDDTVTGVELTLQIGSGLAADRVQVAATVGGASVLAPVVVPDPPRPLFSDETVTVLFDEERVGESVRFRADALMGDELRGSGAVDVTLVRGELVPASLPLGAAAGRQASLRSPR